MEVFESEDTSMAQSSLPDEVDQEPECDGRQVGEVASASEQGDEGEEGPRDRDPEQQRHDGMMPEGGPEGREDLDISPSQAVEGEGDPAQHQPDRKSRQQ